MLYEKFGPLSRAVHVMLTSFVPDRGMGELLDVVIRHDPGYMMSARTLDTWNESETTIFQIESMVRGYLDDYIRTGVERLWPDADGSLGDVFVMVVAGPGPDNPVCLTATVYCDGTPVETFPIGTLTYRLVRN